MKRFWASKVRASSIAIVIGLCAAVMVAILAVVGVKRGHDFKSGGARRPAGVPECISLLRKAIANKPALVSSVSALLDAAKSKMSGDKFDPALIVVTYRDHNSEVKDVVVQVYHNSPAGRPHVLNEAGVVRSRLGDDLFESADNFLGLIYDRVSYLGEESETDRVQRAFQFGLRGDLTLLREQTVDPLRVVAIMP